MFFTTQCLSARKETTMTFCFTRRTALALLAGLAWAGAATAQTWPDKPIRLVVNFAPGGAADVMARALAPVLSGALKQQVIVENKPGAGGNIGTGEVVKAANDGYTLLLSSGGAITINPLIYANMGFNPETALTPVAAVARVLVYLEAHPSVPAASVQEFIAYAKAHPGKLSFASPGSGSSPHLAGEMLKRQAGLQAQHVPYKGAGPALTDVLGGQVQFWFDPGPGLKHVKEGKLRLLAVGSPRRSPQLPDVPTLAESGLPGFDADSLFGIYAPAGTPPQVVQRLHDEINNALQLPAVASAITALGAEPAVLSLSGFVARQVQERERLGVLVKEIGLKLE
jgi:tripartite-type tricarboxylate transporter receptor subunit TctC